MRKSVENKLEELARFLLADKEEKYGLYQNNGGKILFYYYYTYTQDIQWEQAFYKELEESFDVLSTSMTGNSFWEGIPGYFYLYNFLKDNFDCELDISESELIYRNYLQKVMFEQIKKGNYDFLYSSLGVAFYFLQKNEFQCIEEYIDILADVAIEEDGAKLYWLDRSDPEVTPQPNIGLAHGMSSIVIFLTKAYQKGIRKESSKHLLSEAVRYIQSQKIPDSSYINSYPTLSLAEADWHSRLGWCYGDLSIGLGLWQAGRALLEKEWMDEALEVCRKAACRTDLNQNFIFDAGLCHGTAGISQIFRRMYLETSEEVFLSASKYWLKETLHMAKYKDSISGYKSWTPDGYIPTDSSLIEGVSGIALVLLSSITTSSYSEWDKLFLMH